MSRRAVWKYMIDIDSDVTEFQIPEGARFLHCAAQGDQMCMWFEVPADETRTNLRGFRIFGTGDAAINDHMDYVGTGMFAGGRFVFHVYEVNYG